MMDGIVKRVAIAVLLLALLGVAVLLSTHGGDQGSGVPLFGAYQSGMSFSEFKRSQKEDWRLLPDNSAEKRVVVIPNVKLWGASGELRLNWHMDRLMATWFFPPEDMARSVFETAIADLGVVLDMEEESDDTSSRSPRTVDDGTRRVWIWPTAYGRWYIGVADSSIHAERRAWILFND